MVRSGNSLFQTLLSVSATADKLKYDTVWLVSDVPTSEATVARVTAAGVALLVLTTAPPLTEFQQFWNQLPASLTPVIYYPCYVHLDFIRNYL